MKKYLIFWLIVVGVAAWLLRSYAAPGVPLTHDGENHLARFANYKLALKQGQIPPRWAPNLLNGFGYPVLNYNYPLANMLSLPFSIIKIPYETTFKIIVVTSVLAGAVGVYFWIKQLDFSFQAAGFATFAWLLSPYLWNAIFIRGTIGEVTTIALLPWLGWLLERYRRKDQGLVLGVVSLGVMTAFLLSHNVSVLLALPVLGVLSLIRLGWDRDAIFAWAKPWLLSLCLSLWFWIPAWGEKGLVVLGGASLNTTFFTHFPTWHELWFSPLIFGFSFVGSIDSTSFQVGLLAGLIVFLGALLALKSYRSGELKTVSPVALVGIVGILVLVGLQLPVSQPLWQVIPVARFIQFPWRLGIIIMWLTPAVAAFIFESLSQNWRIALILVLAWQIVALSRIPQADRVNHDILHYDQFPQTTTTSHENLPLTLELTVMPDYIPAPQITGSASSPTITKWNGSSHAFSLDVTERSFVTEPTVAFAGWQTIAKNTQTGEKDKLEYDLKTSQGLIGYWLEPGSYQITTRFTQFTPLRLLGNTLTVLGILASSGWLYTQYKRHD